MKKVHIHSAYSGVIEVDAVEISESEWNQITTQQAADLLGINLNNISLRCRQRKIPGAVQIGGRWLIPEESLEGIKIYPEKKNKRYSPS